jgi:exonuclease SbcC
VRPKRLRLKNFGCFRGEHEVDFTGLTSGLFAIAGPTGSGKSTLLDALTWALYGQTPRLGRQLSEHVFSPGESDLSVVVEFAAGPDEYRATRSLRRRQSGVTGAAKLERLADDGRWLTLPETDRIGEYERALTRAVGLDYDGFVRAVMLPQGAFDEFLRGSDAQRRELMKALLRVYTVERMRDLAMAEKSEVKRRLDDDRARIDNEYEGVTPEAEAGLVAQVAGLERGLEARRAALQEARDRLKDLDALAALDAEAKGARDELASLEAEEPAVEEAKSALERAKAAQALAPLVRAHRARERDRATAAARVAELRAAAERAASEWGAAKEAEERALAAREERKGALVARAAELEGAWRPATLLRRHGGGLQMAARADGEPFDEERLAETVALTAQLGELKQLERAAASAARELQAQEAALAARLQDIEKRRQEMAELLERGTRQRQAADEAKAAYERAQVEHQAQALREHLHVGEPCPVCLGVVEALPEVGGHEDLKALEERVRDEQEKLVGLRAEHGAVKKGLEEAEGSVAALEAEVARRRAAHAAAAEELAKAASRFAGLGATAAEVEAALAARLELELARLAQAVATVTGGRDLDQLLAETSDALQALERDVEGARTRRAAAETARAAAQAALEQAEAQEAAAIASAAEAEEELLAALAGSPFAGVEAVEAANQTSEEQAALSRRVERHAERRAAAQGRLAAAERGLAGRAYDPEEHEVVRQRLLAAEQGVQTVSGELGGKQKELETLRQRLESLRELLARARELESRHAVLHELEQALRSHQFEAYVLDHALADLAADASVIVHELTDGRYELDYDGEFYVRDTWMDTHRRSVKTLSGGESFIVSLALALALADSVAGQQSLGALFLDEGFGTLDPEALDSVTEVLTNLTDTGRMVGVITHVSSLTERLPARLLVEKGRDGSRLAWDG